MSAYPEPWFINVVRIIEMNGNNLNQVDELQDVETSCKAVKSVGAQFLQACLEFTSPVFAKKGQLLLGCRTTDSPICS